jgi:hypothetical protein
MTKQRRHCDLADVIIPFVFTTKSEKSAMHSAVEVTRIARVSGCVVLTGRLTLESIFPARSTHFIFDFDLGDSLKNKVKINPPVNHIHSSVTHVVIFT